MADLDLSPDHFEILATRELRKAGLEVTEPRVIRRVRLSEETDGYELDLAARLSGPGAERRLLIACRRQSGPVPREAVERLRERVLKSGAQCGLLFASSTFELDAVRVARDQGVALIRVVDGKLAHDAGGWGPRGHYPSWLPAHMAQLVTLEAGLVTYELLATDRPRAILDRLRP